MSFNGAPDIAGHASRHRRIGAVGCLELSVDERLIAVDPDANEAVGVPCRDRGLLGVDDFEDLHVLAPQREARKVVGIGLNQAFGNRI